MFDDFSCEIKRIRSLLKLYYLKEDLKDKKFKSQHSSILLKTNKNALYHKFVSKHCKSTIADLNVIANTRTKFYALSPAIEILALGLLKVSRLGEQWFILYWNNSRSQLSGVGKDLIFILKTLK
ncbi:hypothetical protein BpHYR1_037339 [Brachionus plicatilis]|uniref:Uncharacterized protein n=1 Tax=Brachionus plicatilis TaxID=10195 RepID=A0A3M7Q0C5_BRAPC|nr:hypothetical protein BpHYR1_037339 [Brachionus plicatilis]